MSVISSMPPCVLFQPTPMVRDSQNLWRKPAAQRKMTPMSDEPMASSDAPVEGAPPPASWWQNPMVRMGAVIVAAVLVTVVVLAMIGNPGDEPGPSVGASPSASASAEISASPSADEPSPSAEPSPTPNDRASIGTGIGVDWETVATFDGAGVGDITAGGPGWVAVGAAGPVGCEICPGLEEYSARIWTSTDGRTWTAASVPDPDDSTLDVVTAGPGGLVAIGQRGESFGIQVLVSSNGLSWTRVEVPEFAPEGTSIRDLAGGSRYVATGSIPTPDGPGRPAIWASTNGVEWTEVFLATTEGWVSQVTADGSGYAAVGSVFQPTGDPARPSWEYPTAWTSADGTSWVETSLPDGSGATGGAARDVLLTPLGLIVVGYAEYSGQVNGFAAWHSPGGTTWHTAPVTPDFLEDLGGGFLVYASADRVFAIGSNCRCGSGLPGRWWTTVDGLNWIEHRETPPILKSVLTFGDGLIAASQADGNGTILISD